MTRAEAADYAATTDRACRALRSLTYGNPSDPAAQRREALEALGDLQQLTDLLRATALGADHRAAPA